MKNINKKIMFLCHGAGNGGAERVITTLASEFAARNYSVLMVTTNKENNDYRLNEQVQREIIVSNAGNAVSRTIDRIARLRKCVKTFEPDCIISFSAIPNIQILLATLGLEQPIIVSERTDPSRYPTGKSGKILRKLLYPRAGRIVFQTSDAMEYFGNNIRKKGIIIPNPIRDDLPERHVGKRRNVIAGIGSLGEQKNWDLALTAGETFFENFPDYEMHIYGEGPQYKELKERIGKSELLKDRVVLKGFSANVLDEICDARIYISSSNYEGISNAMLEALAIGVPAVCTDCPVGGARMYIKNGQNGFLVPVGNADKLAKAMMKIASDDELCEIFSQSSIEIKEQLELSYIIDLWENEIIKLCKQR